MKIPALMLTGLVSISAHGLGKTCYDLTTPPELHRVRNMEPYLTELPVHKFPQGRFEALVKDSTVLVIEDKGNILFFIYAGDRLIPSASFDTVGGAEAILNPGGNKGPVNFEDLEFDSAVAFKDRGQYYLGVNVRVNSVDRVNGHLLKTPLLQRINFEIQLGPGRKTSLKWEDSYRTLPNNKLEKSLSEP